MRVQQKVLPFRQSVIEPASLPSELRVLATSEDGEIMAVVHREHPVTGVQFHPESALTEHGYRLLDRFLHGDASRTESLPDRADLAFAPPPAAAEQAPPVALVR